MIISNVFFLIIFLGWVTTYWKVLDLPYNPDIHLDSRITLIIIISYYKFKMYRYDGKMIIQIIFIIFIIFLNKHSI